MRLGSIGLAVAVVAGLAWWFVLRHDPEVIALLKGNETASAELAEVAPNVAGLPVSTPPDATQSPAQPRTMPRVAVIDSAAAATDQITRLTGRTEAMRSVEVAAETSGLVMSEPLRAGTRVAADALLCQLDPGARAAEMREAEAKVAEASAEASAADTLSERGFTARTTQIARQATLESAKAELDRMRLDFDRLEIRAPFAGVLETDTAEIGSLLAVGEVCATVVDLSQLKVLAFVAERDVDKVNEGAEVRVTLVNGKTRTGRVRFVSRTADMGTRTYTVEAVIENADLALRDGMTAEVEIALDAGMAHRLPLSVLTLDDRGRLGVRVVEEGDIVAFYPTRLLKDEGDSAWLAGLPEEARVIAVGQEFVREGRKVVPVPLERLLDEAGAGGTNASAPNAGDTEDRPTAAVETRG